MNSVLIFFIILTITFPTITYVSTNSWISSSIVLVISALYFFLYAYQKVLKMNKRNKKFHSCYSFINSFIISLGVKGSLLAAFESSKLTMDQDYNKLVEGLSNLNEEERLDYLKKQYDFDIYYLFLSVIRIWVEQGGDIFRLSYYLVEESRRTEDYLIKCESITKRRLAEFSVLWLFTFIILIVLRIALNSFYSLITNYLLFKVAIVLLFLLVIASIHLFIVRSNEIEIRGYQNV